MRSATRQKTYLELGMLEDVKTREVCENAGGNKMFCWCGACVVERTRVHVSRSRGLVSSACQDAGELA